MSQQRSRGRWRNLWWEALVGLAIVLWVVFFPGTGPRPHTRRSLGASQTAWTYALVLAATGTALLAQLYWALRRRPVFWAMAAGYLAVLSGSAYAWFLATGVGLRWGIWFTAVAGAEFAPFAYLVYRKFHVLPGQSR